MPTAAVNLIEKSERARALLHPLRLALVRELRDPDSAAGVARRLGLPRQKVNYHLRELEKEGLVELVEERRKGNCGERILRATARSYVVDPALLGALGESPDQARDAFSASHLVALAARAIRDVARLRAKADEESKRLPTLGLQWEVRFRSGAERAAFTEELAGQVAALVARYHDERAPGGRRFAFFAGGYPAPGQARDEGGVADASSKEETNPSTER